MSYEAFDAHRLACTFVEAAHQGQDEQVRAVLDVIDPSTGEDGAGQFSAFLIALAGMIEHALASKPGASVPQFVAAYRRVLDKAETLANEGE